MKTRTLIILSCVAFSAGAASQNNLAALYVALVGHAIIYMLHVVEVKLNRLLDHSRLTVTGAEAAQ